MKRLEKVLSEGIHGTVSSTVDLLYSDFQRTVAKEFGIKYDNRTAGLLGQEQATLEAALEKAIVAFLKNNDISVRHGT